MATFNKVNDWVEYMSEGANIGSDQFVIALSNTAPASETNNPTADGNGVLANVTEISYTNCSTRNITTASSAQTSGTQNLSLTDLTLTASGGTVGAFRYVYIYDDTLAGDPIVGYWDYGSSITMADTETFLIDFTANSFTLT